MDKDLQDVLTYGLGAVTGYVTIISVIYLFIKDLKIIMIYSILLTILLWLAYLNRKVSRLIRFINKIRMEEHYVKKRS